jgi:tetratricopeptide (TPR) repeat protein
MIEDILIPEELLQLDKLLSATELIEDSSFLAILGSDSSDLSISLDNYLTQNINSLKKLDLKTNNPLQEIIEFNLTNDFLLLNLFDYVTNDSIKNLLFFRDFISDYKLKIIFIIDKTNYQNILKDAIDFYNISTFSFLFSTYKIEEIKELDKKDLSDLQKEYKEKIKTLNKKQKANFLFEIGLKFQKYGEIKEALYYINEAKKIIEKNASLEDIIKIKSILSSLYRDIGNFIICEKYLYECESYYKKNKNNSIYKEIIENFCVLYQHSSNFDKALEYCDKLYTLAKETNDKEYELVSYQQYTFIYSKLNDSNKKEEYLEKAFSLAKETNNSFILAHLYQSKAVNYMNINKYIKALDNLNKALELYKTQENIFMINHMYYKIGYIYYQLLDYKKSLVYLNWSYKFFDKNGMKSESITNLRSISFNYTYLYEFDKALNHIFKSLDIAKSLKKQNEIIDILLQINQIYTIKEDFENALKYLDEAYKVTLKIKDFNLFDINLRYSNTYKDIDNLTKAYEYYQKAVDSKELTENQKAYLYELYGEILNKDNKYQEALTFFQDSLKNAKKMNDLHRILSVEENLAYTYKKLENSAMANRFFMEVINKLKIINKNNPKIKKLEKELE